MTQRMKSVDSVVLALSPRKTIFKIVETDLQVKGAILKKTIRTKFRACGETELCVS